MRSGKAPKRDIQPDPIYNSKLVTKIINKVMRDGKKSTALGIIYKAFEEIEKGGKNPMTILDSAMANISPKMEVRPRRVGGASYQVPVEVRGERRESLGIRWLIGAARSRSNKEFHSFSAKFAAELVAAAEGQGAAVKRREDTLRAAEANKAFAHFRW
ncbi:MAG: ribosomal protein S7 [uncultured bacterium]|uniref:Small ribosomal subunit protein uS7 n=4 Tax=Candidatus Daviesiibacteriota TaxID=1752718 RepID=A0A0G0F1C2_9BACT|nr:MAG: ribosomal protein S7 [uncultured bacterium]KKQ07460.1 MAG: 30S ribosomal protein S7 [Candidatus Daviesbacteria bacterium GW2011_GWB1_36_5]KKQ14738.1 MAG: 30S ribosomal protein S7 [Candidatus Daviesbacteria bacterium GW2011_GWA1_36_8]OGE17068.1 MAG: 30S ribosomal protein S7 [Candidatus Daviesbacteria bacterium RIFCSPHIGHO2_01_FULL_36_37]OGE32700.1 MAG: 30S ribosomal protein S7 [Candidatus Daviesbacteria bacterium RIFCSPHIGHO2_02_FULL_37_9]OGE36112.1 MAG: 30S ribosomal protein S7 [Candid